MQTQLSFAHRKPAFRRVFDASKRESLYKGRLQGIPRYMRDSRQRHPAHAFMEKVDLGNIRAMHVEMVVRN